jgi:hypothetical protein
MRKSLSAYQGSGENGSERVRFKKKKGFWSFNAPGAIGTEIHWTFWPRASSARG